MITVRLKPFYVNSPQDLGFCFSRNIHYIDYEGQEHYFTLTVFPTYLEKKVKLLHYFMNYMKEHLLKAGANIEVREGDELSRIPSLKTWFRTSRAVVMHLTNGTLQVRRRVHLEVSVLLLVVGACFGFTADLPDGSIQLAT